MNSNGAEDQDPRAELFDAIGHPTRIKILQVLNAKPMGFSELKRSVGIESSGNMSFHLNKLMYLVKTASDGNYVLTDAGKEALWSVGNITGVSSTESGGGFQVRRSRKYDKRIAAILIVGLLVLGSIGGLQQLQLSTQQQEISSQQQQIGLYVNQAHPFAIGQAASLVIGQENFTSYEAATSRNGFTNPGQALFDSGGNLWVEDYSNSRVLEFKPPFTTSMDASLVIGQQNFTSTGTTAGPSASTLSMPRPIAFDSSGNLWVNDFGHNRVLEFEPPFHTGMSAALVIGQRDFRSDIKGVSRNILTDPAGIAFDSSRNLWLVDGGNNRVLEFSPPFSDGMNASLVIGQRDFQSSKSSTTRSGLSSRVFSDLAFDKSGNLWVGDAGNNRVLEFKLPFKNGMDASIVIGQLSFNLQAIPFNTSSCPHIYDGLAFDNTGNLWVSINCRLLEFQPPLEVFGLQPSFELGQPDFTSFAWVGGPNGLVAPLKMGFDASGNLWVPDFDQNRVLEFTSAASTPHTTTTSWLPTNYGQLELIAVVAGLLVIGSMAGISVWNRRTSSKITGDRGA